MGKRSYALVCSSNQNRSMEAHALLQAKGFEVASFGTGQNVKLPGQSIQEPVVYEFGTPYTAMLQDLRQRSEEYYRKRGILQMLERNASIKSAPERWQTTEKTFDVAFTFEERVMDQLIEDMANRRSAGVKPLLIVNLDVVDNHEEAASAAPVALRFCELLEDAEDVFGEVDAVIEQFQSEIGKSTLHEVAYY